MFLSEVHHALERGETLVPVCSPSCSGKRRYSCPCLESITLWKEKRLLSLSGVHHALEREETLVPLWSPSRYGKRRDSCSSLESITLWKEKRLLSLSAVHHALEREETLVPVCSPTRSGMRRDSCPCLESITQLLACQYIPPIELPRTLSFPRKDVNFCHVTWRHTPADSNRQSECSLPLSQQPTPNRQSLIGRLDN